MNYRRWLIVGYLLVLMAFTTSVLLIPGQKYDTLTTSDSGWFYDMAADIEENNGIVGNNRLSHAPYGLPYGSDFSQSLMTVMLYRAIHAVSPDVSLMDVVRYWAPLIFALTLIPLFLIGRELGGDLAGCAAAFFAAVLTSSIYWMKVGSFDRDPIMSTILAAWVMYLTIRLFKAPRSSIPTFAVLGGLVYGLFGLSWAGWWYLVPIIVGGLLFALLVKFLEKLVHGAIGASGALLSSLREHLGLIAGVVSVLLLVTIALCTVGGQAPRLWIGIIQTLFGYAGIGGGAGVTFTRYAGEMAAPESWSDVIYSFYGGGDLTVGTASIPILTVLISILSTLALLKFCWSRKRWELLAFPWLIVLMAMVWPGAGQARFTRLWWPLVPVLAGVGVAVLASLIRRASFEQFGGWLEHLQRPILIAFCASIIATPFILNAYGTAEHTTPPTEWNFSGLDAGYMDAFDWLRENTPESSVVAIQWSYGHLLTGASRRASVTDGSEVRGEEGVWENDPSFTIRPPDYIYYVQDHTGYIYGINANPRSYAVNGRRIDVQQLPTMGEDEFRWVISTYRDNYNCKIDYIVFDAAQYLQAMNAQKWGPAKILLDSTRKATSQTVSTEDQNYVFNFGENRENVVFTPTGDVYLRTDSESKHLDGYAFFAVTISEGGQISLSDFYGFFPPPSAPDIPETLLVFLDERGGIVTALLVESKSAEINALPIPMGIRIFEGNVGDFITDYLQIGYTSSNGLVKVAQVIHENMP